MQAARAHAGGAPDPLEANPGLEAMLPGEPADEDGFAPEDQARSAAKAMIRDQHWQRRLPLLISLRLLRRDGAYDLTLDDAWSQHVPVEPPSQAWTARQLAESGRGLLLLLDGLDEVPHGQHRANILARIAALRAMYPAMQIVLTTRPGALGEHDLPDWRRIAVEELDRNQRAEFVAHWHQALAMRGGHPDSDAVIRALQQALLREYDSTPALARLATNPLLCAALCALHFMHRKALAEEGWRPGARFAGFPPGNVLPGHIWSLCEDVTRMLVHLRDDTRGLLADGAVRLDYGTKSKLLERIAFAMTAVGASAISRAEAIEEVVHAVQGFPTPPVATPMQVLDDLILRSGVLRGAAEDAVEFAHNTLKSFLAAKYHLGQNAPKDFAQRVLVASEDDLRSGLDELAVFAAASPLHPKYAARLLLAMIDAIEKRRGRLGRMFAGQDASAARQVQLLALRCEAVARDLPPDLRARVRAVAAQLFPPRTPAEADQLAILGDAALPHLRYEQMPDRTAEAAAARCLRLIGTPAADALLRGYHATRSNDTAAEVIAAGHEPLALPLVRASISNRDGAQFSRFAPNIRRLQPLVEHSADVEALNLGECPVEDWSPLTAMSNLKHVSAKRTAIADLTPLAVATLESVDVSWSEQVRSLAPLARCARLQSVNCYHTGVGDLAPIARLPALQRLLAGGCRRIGTVDCLRDAIGLVELGIGVTDVSDIAPLARLTKLRALDITGLDGVKLQHLVDLVALEKLEASFIDDPDPSALHALVSLEELWLQAARFASFDFLQHLPALRTLIAPRTRLADLAPLQNAKELQYLNVEKTMVNVLRPLASLPEMRFLSVAGSPVSALDGLDGLPKLTWLKLSNCRQLVSIDGLARVPSLETLDLDNTAIRSLVPLRGASALRSLHIRGTPIDDFRPLLELPALKIVYLGRNELAAQAAVMKALQAKGVDVIARGD